MDNNITKDGRKRLLEFIKSPHGIILSVTIVILFLIFGLLTIIGGNATEPELFYTEHDPASGEEVYFGPETGAEWDHIYWVGFENGISSHNIDISYMVVIKNIIADYAKKEDITLERVSFLKDSYIRKGFRLYEFAVVLNIDQITLKIRMDLSRDLQNTTQDTDYHIYDESGNEVYSITITGENLCQFANKGCSVDPEAL